MERLTARDGKSAYFPHCFKMCEGFPHGCEKCHFVEEICECLAAYEDSGLAPEQITELTRRATLDGYMEGVKYAIYEIFKEADIPGSQEIRDSGDTDDGMCARAAKRIRAELPAAPENKALTLEQLRGMDGEPVWIVEAPDWGHWELSERAEDYLDDRDPDFYGMKHDDPAGRYGLHVLGWLAFARRPEGSEP